MAGYLVTWNQVASSTIPELVCGKITRSLLGSHRGTYMEIPGRPGSWYFPEERGRRQIKIECHIEASSFPTGRRDAVTEVANWLDINAEAHLEISDAPGIFYLGVLDTVPDVDEWREFGVFDLVWLIDPYGYDNDADAEDFVQQTGDSWTFDFGVLSATYPVVEITNDSGGNIAGFTLTINGSSIVYSGTIADGATVTVNSIGMAVLAGANDDIMLTGVYEPTDMLMTGVTGSFPVLQPGSNTLSIDSATASADVTVRVNYRKRYRN